MLNHKGDRYRFFCPRFLRCGQRLQIKIHAGKATVFPSEAFELSPFDLRKKEGKNAVSAIRPKKHDVRKTQADRKHIRRCDVSLRARVRVCVLLKHFFKVNKFLLSFHSFTLNYGGDSKVINSQVKV